ncbi:MAG: YtxH domain-containing protein [Anaerolineae bacterium]|nr:YtxH domain-containing protein [Anaerolineae bacterium]
MTDKTRGNVGSFVMGFFVGGLVSAAIALLNAPQSGKETREQVMAKGIELRDRAGEEVQRIRTQVEDMIAEVRIQTDDVQARLAKQLEVVQARMAHAIEEGKRGAYAVREELTGSTAHEELAGNIKDEAA